MPQAAAATAACAAALAKVKTVQVASFVAEAVRKALCEAIEAGRDAVLAKWSSMDLQMVPAVKEALALEPQWAAFRASFEGKLPLQQEHPEYDQLAQHLAKKFVKALKKF